MANMIGDSLLSFTHSKYVAEMLIIHYLAATQEIRSNICGLIFYSQTQGIWKSLAIKMTMSLFAVFTEEINP